MADRLLSLVPTHPNGRGWAHQAVAPRAAVALLAGCVLLAACAACGGDGSTLVVVTPFDGRVLGAVESAFEAAHPDVNARLLSRSDHDALEALREGGLGAHVWWGADWHALAEAAAAGLSTPYEPPWASAVDEGVRDPDGHWYGIHASPVVLAFDTRSVSRARAPRDWLDLRHLRWRGQLVLPPAEGETMRAIVEQGMLEELRRARVEFAGMDWLRRIQETASGHASDEREQTRRLSAGEASLTFLPAHRAAALAEENGWLAARMMESGGPRLVRGIALLAPPPELVEPARAFIDWAGTEQAMRLVMEHTGWGPAVTGTGVARDAGWPAVGSGFPVWTFAADTLAERAGEWYGEWSRAVRTMPPAVPLGY